MMAERNDGKAAVHCVHRMPFGPCPVDERQPAAGYRFRLWAPTVKEVEVGLVDPAGGKRYYPCARSGGWHSCRIAEARAGGRYVFRLEGEREVPDPASRFNPQDVHGPSQLTDPAAFAWDREWCGRPWEEAVIYELHIGTFTPEGSYAAAEARLEELAGLGITAIELMPLADFAGRRGWGYDGVLPFAPEAAYGTPEELKHFIQAAHRCGLMVFLDVVYNHFGPEGNYLHGYAPQFFTAAHQTPWGEAINYEGPAGATVRKFFIHNALYWLEEFRFDGLRLDAVHAIFDDTQPHFLEELSRQVRSQLGERHIDLVLENVANDAGRLGRPGTAGRFDAQWNDDFHHAAHVVLTGERDGYYADFAERPVAQLMRCLGEGFAFQGEPSAFHHRRRGTSSAGLPASAFVNFLQNHDQVGNRAFGERLAGLVAAPRLRALVALQLLAPSPPLIFMGEEAGATTPFLYFCDYRGELAKAVRDGRQREFTDFRGFAADGGREIPDPCAEATFLACKLDWAAREEPAGREWLALYHELLELRRVFVLPMLPSLRAGHCAMLMNGERAFEIRWPAVRGFALMLRANLDDRVSPSFAVPDFVPFAMLGPAAPEAGQLGPWSVHAYRLPGKETAA
jgi:maltooligosyltrehalose trehalohydrolase